MKKVFLFLAVFFVALSAAAANDYFNVVTFHLKDNSKVDLVITNKVKMNFTDTHLIVEGTDSEVAIERSKLAKFTHSYDENAALEEVSAANSMLLQGDKVVFYGLPADSSVAVYSLAGVEMISTVAQGDYVLDLSGLSKGVYIVSANGNSLKVTVK